MNDDRTTDFYARLVSLRLDVDRLAGAMEAESAEAQRALSCYGRAKRLLNIFLGRAANHQTRACHLGQCLAGCADRLKQLETEADLAEQDPEKVRVVKRDLRDIAERIKHWRVESDGLS